MNINLTLVSADGFQFPVLRQAFSVACYFTDVSHMTNEEIQKAVEQVMGIGGMTVNERLFASGLFSEFDKAKINDKDKAEFILEQLQVEKTSIEKILQ